MKERAELIFSEISPYKGNRFLFRKAVRFCILLETPDSLQTPAAVSREGVVNQAYVKKTQYEGVDGMRVAQCEVQDGALVNTVMNIWGPQTIIYRLAKGFFTIQTVLGGKFSIKSIT